MSKEEELSKKDNGATSGTWWLCSTTGQPANGNRLHTRIEGRFVTIFRHRDVLSAIDSVCHHAGGPLTEGKVEDIEDLGMTVVSCPWHRFKVSIDRGIKVYEAIEIVDGKPTAMGWRAGKVVQRPHEVLEKGNNIYVKLQDIYSSEPCTSDQDASSDLCGKFFELYPETPVACGDEI